MIRQAFDRSRLAETAHIRGRIEADKRRRRDFTRQRQDRERKEELDDKAEAEASAVAMAVAVSPAATTQQIAAFEADLTIYDTATVDALMANDRQLNQVRAVMDDILSRAFVMDDGRRVFRTEDGTQVFDEFGEELTADQIDPVTILDHHPTWEEFAPVFAEHNALMQERQALIDYQQKLDDAREAVAEGEITEAELEDLQAGLIADMPDSVRVRLPQDHSMIEVAKTTDAPTVMEVSEVKTPTLDGLQVLVPLTPSGV